MHAAIMLYIIVNSYWYSNNYSMLATYLTIRYITLAWKAIAQTMMVTISYYATQLILVHNQALWSQIWELHNSYLIINLKS